MYNISHFLKFILPLSSQPFSRYVGLYWCNFMQGTFSQSVADSCGCARYMAIM